MQLCFLGVLRLVGLHKGLLKISSGKVCGVRTHSPLEGPRGRTHFVLVSAPRVARLDAQDSAAKAVSI